jgi:hypothetical protein
MQGSVRKRAQRFCKLEARHENSPPRPLAPEELDPLVGAATRENVTIIHKSMRAYDTHVNLERAGCLLRWKQIADLRTYFRTLCLQCRPRRLLLW